MSFSQAQPVTVTLTAGSELYVPTVPAVNVQAAQKVGVAVAGSNQTVTVAPSE
jgi:hypothetical protein